MSEKRVQSVLPEDLAKEFGRLVEKLGTSESAALQWLIREWSRREDGSNTKEQRLTRIEADMAQTRSQIGLLTTLVWGLLKQLSTVASPQGGDITIVLDREFLEGMLKEAK